MKERLLFGGEMCRRFGFAIITGLIIAFCYVAGYYLDRYDTLDLLNGKFYLQWLAVATMISVFVHFLWKFVNRSEERDEKQRKHRFPIPYWGCVVILLLCWLPALLSIFPGAFSYDAHQEWEEVSTGLITAHHPVAHVLLLGGLVEAFYTMTGSYNVGMAVYTILQMIILANVFAKTISFMEDFGIPCMWQVFALVFYSLSPVIQLFSISATKDVLFSAAELMFFMLAVLFFCRKDVFFTGRRKLIGFTVAALGTMILRNNGLYIVLFMLVLMAFFCGKYRKKFAIMLLAVLLFYGLYVGPVYHLFSVTPGGIEEMLSVPIQQMARVHKYDYESLEQEDLELLYQVLPKENLDLYRATVSDFVKKGFDREGFEANKVDFFKLWFRWGLEHPLTYVNSFLVNTVDFWYPNAIVDGYKDAYGRSSYFDYQVDDPGTEIIIFPRVHDFYENLSLNKEAQKAPLAFLVLSPGWYFVVAFVIFMYLWCYRKKELVVPMFILIISMLTVLLGPMALVRYVLIFYYLFPILLTMFFCANKYKSREAETKCE